MNNSQFRRLVLDTPRAKPGNDNTSKPISTPGRKDGVVPSGALGSKLRSSIPMTPRSVSGIDFARQLAERQQGQDQKKTLKKFRSSAAPKGVKLPAGYRDRTQLREGTNDDDDGKERGAATQGDDAATRIAALEELVKNGEMEQDMFEKLRDEIVGGDIGTTHLVKGLDYKLLERVRKGEDVLKDDGSRKEGAEEEEDMDGAKLDEEFEKLEEKEVVPVVRVHEKEEKKREMLPPPLPPPPVTVAGKKRSRNEILAELKASRKVAVEAAKAAAAQPTLGPKFKKVGEKREKTRIERDERGREILITTDENGRVKRKVRKGGGGDAGGSSSLPMPEKDAKPLGMDVPETLLSALNGKNGEEEQDETLGNIFEDAGSDYDPLAGMEEEDDDDDDSNEERRDLADLASKTKSKDNDEVDPAKSTSSANEEDKNDNKAATAISPEEAAPPAESSNSSKPRNYFGTTAEDTTINNTSSHPPKSKFNPLSDPSILAALRKASTLDPSHLQSRLTKSSTTATTNPSSLTDNGHDNEDEDEESRKLRLREKLLSSAQNDRDAEDLDMGFGSSRFDDVEDLDDDGGGKRTKLSIWKGTRGGNDDGVDGGGDGTGGGEKQGQKRKRGPKKKKGDKNSAADVLRIVEQRKNKS
ncbi:MAG: hypothetical protein M1823_001821 [Watsoniomyces obsoletus]|nr:MAG: hypothetical protein M1823_001821 [Watsoniomyces obsoletus]